jgi:hypothetical protein
LDGIMIHDTLLPVLRAQSMVALHADLDHGQSGRSRRDNPDRRHHRGKYVLNTVEP